MKRNRLSITVLLLGRVFAVESNIQRLIEPKEINEQEANEEFKIIHCNENLKEIGKNDSVTNFQGISQRYQLSTMEFASANNDNIQFVNAGKSRPAIKHGFVEMVDYAFNYHVPMAFSPDHIWTMIMQGFANIVNADPDKYRNVFVNHSGKITLEVEIVEFGKNGWSQAIKEIATDAAKHIGEQYKDLLTAQFSTTGPTETTINSLNLMNAMQNFFTYVTTTDCGIKRVKLLGTLKDWNHLRQKVRKLFNAKELDLQWWLYYVLPILDNFLVSYIDQDEVDPLFWQTIYKHWNLDYSGAQPMVDGWILNFFPLVTSIEDNTITERNKEMVRLKTHYERVNMTADPEKFFWKPPGIKRCSIPSGFQATPFTWVLYGEPINMKFHGGMLGITKVGDYIQPVLQWAVERKTESKCPNGHALEKFTRWYEGQKKYERILCNMCNADECDSDEINLLSQPHYHRCLTCQYNLCAGCYQSST